MPIPTTLSPADLSALRAAVAAAEPAYLADLERLVNIDCGSYTKAGVDEVGAWTADRLRSLGATVRAEPNDLGLGETVIADFPGTDPDGVTLLCIGHMDTVFDPGTAAERPFAHQGRHRDRPRRDRHEERPAGRPVRDRRDPRGPRRAPARTPGVRRQPRRGDRLAGVDPAHPRPGGGRRRVPGPRVRPRQRRHRLVAQGQPRARHHRPWPRGARRRRAREGPQRDPRGGAHRHRAARAQRPLAGGHRQRRGHQGRDAAQRRGRELLDGGRRARGHPRRPGGGRGRHPRGLRAHRDPRRHRRRHRGSAPLADGEARAVGSAGGPRGGDRGGPRLPAPRRRHRRGLGREHDGGHGRADDRRAGTDRRPRPFAGRVPGGRLDRAPHRPAGRADHGDRPRPGGARLAGGAAGEPGGGGDTRSAPAPR